MKSIIATSALTRAYTLLMQIGVTILVARMLEPAGRGEAATVTALSLIIATLSHMSLGAAYSKYALENQSKHWLEHLFGATIRACVLSSVIALILYFCVILFAPSNIISDIGYNSLILGAALIPFSIWNVYSHDLLAVNNQVKQYAIRNSIVKTSGSIGIITFTYTLGIKGFLLSVVLVAIAQSIVSYRLLLKFCTPAFAEGWRGTVSLLKRGLGFHPVVVGNVLIVSIDIIMIKAFCGEAAAGHYKIAAEALSAGTAILAASSTPLHGLIVRQGVDGTVSLTLRYASRVSFMCILLAILAWAFAPFLIPLAFGAEFRQTVPVAQILPFSLVGQAFVFLLMPQIIARGARARFSIWMAALILLNGVLNWILINAIGMTGAAYASVITTAIYGACVFLYVFTLSSSSRVDP